MNANIKNIDEYIKTFPENIQQRLEQVRATIKKAAPGAEESIRYSMPAYKLNKRPWYILRDTVNI